MQVWVLSDEHIYNALKKHLDKVTKYALIEDAHTLGFRSLQVIEAGAPVFGAILVESDAQLIFQAIQWIHQTWQVSDFVNFDALTALSPAALEGHDYLIAIPKRCLRSAGRGDLQTGPLLYEELAYSDSVQIALAARYSGESEMLLDPQLNVFSGFGLDHDASFERTIVENSQCFAWDNVSGEVLQSGRRLAVRAGALYVVAPRHEYRLGAMDAFLRGRELF